MTQPVRRGRGSLPVWDPFRELEELHTRMDRLMQSPFLLAPNSAPPGHGRHWPTSRTPRTRT